MKHILSYVCPKIHQEKQKGCWINQHLFCFSRSVFLRFVYFGNVTCKNQRNFHIKYNEENNSNKEKGEEIWD